MAPPFATADVFLAVAEPRRRAILDLLLEGERAVGDLVERLGLAQPQVSKHLRVLKEVGLVAVRKAGQHRFYSVHGAQLQVVHDWAGQYWQHHLDQVKVRAERVARRRKAENQTGGKL